MQQNYRLTIAYDGTRFFGWERQPGKDTIQGKLEAVLGELQGAPVNVIGAGRTDAGVHARAMTANVVLDTALTPEEIRDYMNRYLPDAIAVREVKEAAPRFHARYNALGKTYRYTCHVGAVKPVFDRKYVTLLDYEPDVERMRLAAELLRGTRLSVIEVAGRVGYLNQSKFSAAFRRAYGRSPLEYRREGKLPGNE